MADQGRSRIQIEGAIQKAPGRARRATERAAAAALRVRSLRLPADLPGDGCGRKRRRHQPRHVRRQPAGLPGVQLQTSERDGTGTRFSLAHHPRSAGARADRHFQPILLRGGADRSRASRRSCAAKACRTHRIDEKKVWHDRYRSIVNLEKHLHRNGTRIIKFFLHLSKEEQRKRFLARIDEPEKNWKFSLADIAERKFWKQYMKAYEECLSATSTARRALVCRSRRRQGERSADRIQDCPRYARRLKMAYPETSAKRRRELQSIRKRLAK